MELLEKLGKTGESIDWEMTPADTFGIFESWGGKERVRNKNERFYYFYIDNWDPPAKLYLMERGIKFARVLAQIDAPKAIINRSIAGQGKGLIDKSYAIDQELARWLRENVVKVTNDSLVIPIENIIDEGVMPSGLPLYDAPAPQLEKLSLRSKPAIIDEDDLPAIVKQGGFFDTRYNPQGSFANYLVDNNDQLTVTDLKTNLMWQRQGCDIASRRKVQTYLAEMNQQNFAGFSDWRLPTIEEALSLLTPKLHNTLYLHPCFSKLQPFVCLADQRQPGGYWFIDFKQGTIYWASGTNPGGFGRFCRTV